MTADTAARAREILDGLEGVTPGKWQVIETRHPWRLKPKPEWGRPEEKTGEHTERQIATVWHHPQSHAPWQIVCHASGIGVDKAVHFVHIEENDAAHIARCSPDNLRPILEAAIRTSDLEARVASLEAENAVLRKALEPFAAFIDQSDHSGVHGARAICKVPHDMTDAELAELVDPSSSIKITTGELAFGNHRGDAPKQKVISTGDLRAAARALLTGEAKDA